MPESSLVVQLLWQSAFVPFAVALALLGACRAVRLDGIGAVLAVTAAFMASYFATLHAQWSLVPKLAMDWMPWIALVAAAAGITTDHVSGAGKRLALRIATGLAVGAAVVWGAVGTLGSTRSALAVVVVGLLIALVWTAKVPLADGGARRPLMLAMVAGGAGVSMMLDSSQQIGQLSGALAVALGACMLFNLPRPRIAFPPAATGTAVVILGALIANAHLYAGFSLGYVALLLGALLADPLVAAATRLRGRSIHQRSWIPAAVLTALPVMVTVVMVVKTAQVQGGY